ncbi:hypothetical protein E2C01_027625 [Portunus trituberculatus]|uniref:Endonuclease/exonuclease/phosphatase domain-containing protein n=1 Tax=Portunus trituberculatus TaxID=210409 RepID=A0A5B7EIL6_PORTR|nr:hypothetical protein [Portunus trituberculatus]
MYRPQWQGSEPLTYLTNLLDGIMAAHNCQNIAIVGNLNQHLIMRSFTELIVVQGLRNHVDFPTHQHGGSLDPVLTDLAGDSVQCCPLDVMATFDHLAILSTFIHAPAREEKHHRTIWLWNCTDWDVARRALSEYLWDSVLICELHHDIRSFTTILLNLQQHHVPHRSYTTSPKDQP